MEKKQLQASKTKKKKRKLPPPVPPPPYSSADLKQNRLASNKTPMAKNTASRNKRRKADPTNIQASSASMSRPCDGHSVANDGDVNLDSTTRARRMFEWLIAPIPIEKFYKEYYEKKPLLIRRKDICFSKKSSTQGSRSRCYYDGWFSKTEIDKILRTHELTFGSDIDITRCRTNLQPFQDILLGIASDSRTAYDRILIPQRQHQQIMSGSTFAQAARSDSFVHKSILPQCGICW
jgi:hypothetical protein